MAALQGNGKVRLIAKDGRYRENAGSSAMRAEVARRGASGSDQNKLMGKVARIGGVDAGLENYFIEFDVTPDITESGSATYSDISDIRAAASILLYKGSPSRTFSITGKLVARNEIEAARVVKQIHILKSWRMPESYTGGFNAGVPTLLYLQGYGKMFKDIPTVMTDLTIEFSSEFDAINGGEGVVKFDVSSTKSYSEDVNSFVPIIVPVSITLREAHSTDADLEGMKSFDILKYRTGNFTHW